MTTTVRRLRGLRPLLAPGAFARFLLVGLLNTLFGYGVFCGALALTDHAMIALTIATVAGVLFNFRSIGGLVFQSSNPRRLGRFVGVYAFLFVLNALALAGLQGFGLPPAVAQAGLLLPLSLLSFHLNRRLVFHMAAHEDART